MPNVGERLNDPDRMRLWEERFKRETGLLDRSRYKIFYCRVHPAPILLLGMNPGGDPETVAPNGMDRIGKGAPHSASATYHEGDEHDLLDCGWPRQNDLMQLLSVLSGDKEAIRSRVVMTNMAFRRARKNSEIDGPK